MKLRNGVTVKLEQNGGLKGMGAHVCRDCYFYENDIPCDDYLDRDTDNCYATLVYKEVK